MSIVLACAFPDAAILLCDSRVSMRGTSRRSDSLRKSYSLGPFLAVGFASSNVEISEKIVSVMTDYVKNHAKSQNTRYLLSKLPKVCRYYYRKFTETDSKKPSMEFIFAGIDKTAGAIISGKKLFAFLTRAMKNKGGSAAISSRIVWGMERQKGDKLPLPKPASIVARLVFPTGHYREGVGLGYSVAGSDTKASKKLREAFEQAMIVGSDEPAIRHAMIGSIIEDHRREQKIDTIGGLTQTLLINEKGIFPMGYSYTKIKRDGSKGDGISMRFNKGNWIQKRTRDGKQIKVSKLSEITRQNEKFEAKSIKL